jgi:C1A family cysteine protease
MNVHRFGWKKDRPDHRDLVFSVSSPRQVFPPVDLRSKFPLPPFDQGDLGSCTANACAKLLTFDQQRDGLQIMMPSRLFMYFNERLIEGDVDEDGGATIRDTIKSVARFGACPEAEWPYDVSRFSVKPSDACYASALKQCAVVYKRVTPSLGSIMAALTMGYPIICGISVYESFEGDDVAATGIIPSPDVHAEQLLGGHAVVIAGADVEADFAWLGNSWGEGWGLKGWAKIPLRHYLLDPNLASDFWIVKQVGSRVKAA